MKHDEIKFLLSGFRKGQKYEKEDPKIAEALAHAKSDEELEAWLNEQHEIDHTLVEALKQVTPHSALKSEIMAGGELVQRARKHRFFRNMGLLAVAALLVLGFTIFKITKEPEQPHFASVEDVSLAIMGDLESGAAQFDMMADGRTIGDLVKTSLPTPIRTTSGLSNLPAKGCKEFTVGGHSIFIVCFDLQGKTCHLAIIDNPSNLSGYTQEIKALASNEQWNGKKWRDDDFGYLLITNAKNPISSIESIDI